MEVGGSVLKRALPPAPAPPAPAVPRRSSIANTSSRFYQAPPNSTAAFYQAPACVLKTSAQIISEARAAMTSTHAVHTRRPFTPRDSHRILFGPSNARSRRPPSAVSIRQVHFHDVDSSVLPKLVDVDQNQNGGANNGLTLSGVALLKSQNGRWRLPAIPHRNSNQLLEKLPEEQVEHKRVAQERKKAEVREQEKEEKGEGEEKKGEEPATDVGDNNSKKNKKKKTWPITKSGCFAQHLHGGEPPQKVVGMEELMARSDRVGSGLVGSDRMVADLADEDNRINEARVDLAHAQKDNVETALARIGQLQDCSSEADLSNALDRLYAALEREGDTIVRNVKAKAAILKTLHPFIEVSSEPLLLRLARVILALRVTGQNLSAICKIVFKVSRSDKHDDFFLENNILALFVESLGRASPLEDAEACIYGYGALKFLTMNSAVSAALLKLGLLQLIVLHMKIVNNSRLELAPIAEQTSHALFQLTGALRNLASDDQLFAALLSTGACAELCRSLQLFSADLDLVCNISRTLSIISTDDGCCQAIVDSEDGFKTITKILRKFPGRQDVVVRLGYALGNVVAKSNAARIKLYQEPEALRVILDLMDSYLEKDLQSSMTIEVEGNNVNLHHQLGSDGSVEDVLIKMIRIIANMSLHPDVGMGLACASMIPSDDDDDDDDDDKNNNNDLESGYQHQTQNKKDAERLIVMLLKVLRRKSVTESEELVVSALSALNNLSYYAASSSPSEGPFALRHIELAEALNQLLTSDNEECLTEVARVLGNLTRSKQVRDFLLETGGVCLLLRGLLRENAELLTATAGVLVNLMADWDKRLALKEDNGIARLIWVLGRWGTGHWRLANLICQVLWNFCIDSTDLCTAFGLRPINNLLAILVELLDEERLWGLSEEEEEGEGRLEVGRGAREEAVLASCEYKQWEEFALVATNLLEKIELCIDHPYQQ